MMDIAIQQPVSTQPIWQKVGRFFVTHHNRLQFVGYEVANIILVVHETYRSGITAYGFNLETYAALFFLLGSACIWWFDPEKRAHLLCLGGIALTIGGGFLVGAGYGLTGWAVVLASMESARGGLLAWQAQANTMSGQRYLLSARYQRLLKIVQYLLRWYVFLINFISAKFDRIGHFINQRPFVTGTLVKAPFRLEFIVKKALVGDWIGVAVGLSWMILGDGGLVFNDAKLKAQVLSLSQPVEKSA